jgi:hypothetical protein
MKKHVAITVGASLASVLCVSTANAQTVVTTPPQQTVVAAPPSQTVVTTRGRDTVVAGGPNSALLSSGLFVFGVPYLTSVVVAATSSRPEDKNLYIPVVGPWLDFAQREDCGSIGQRSCDNETVNKVLLGADGILQGLGALQIVGAFLMPETRTVTTVATEPRIMVGPTRVGRTGYGLAAAGTF